MRVLHDWSTRSATAASSRTRDPASAIFTLTPKPDESPRIAVEDRSLAKWEQRRAARKVPGAGSIIRPPLPLGEGWGEGTPPQVERRASTSTPENAAFGFRRHFSLTPKPLSRRERGEDGTPFLAIMIHGDSSAPKPLSRRERGGKRTPLSLIHGWSFRSPSISFGRIRPSSSRRSRRSSCVGSWESRCS